jgi:hypothetical protein
VKPLVVDICRFLLPSLSGSADAAALAGLSLTRGTRDENLGLGCARHLRRSPTDS